VDDAGMEAIPYFIPRQSRIHFWAAYQWFFGSPNWGMNLLYASVCQLIPIAGPMVLTGWLIEALVPKVAEEWPGWESKGPYPDFTFDRFMPYLQRGLWPLLASLVAGMVIALPAAVIITVAAMLIPLSHGNPVAVAIAVAMIMAMGLVAAVGSMVVMTPLMLRAALFQDFGAAFAWPWIKDFISRTWKEMLLEIIFLWLTAIPLMMIGYAMCIVGVYPAAALLSIANWHLNLQIYRLYVTRGGIPLTPKGFPPPIPEGAA
jgi:hypothetical protein